jgi:hypothetical protein
MAWDIYGNTLRRGYCEVHPSVPEEYPCMYCMLDIERENERHSDQIRMDNLIREHHEEMLHEAVEEEELSIIAENVNMIAKFLIVN